MKELKIIAGSLVEFVVDGNLYVINPNYSNNHYWVTDEEKDRYNKNAKGWSIRKEFAKKIIDLGI